MDHLVTARILNWYHSKGFWNNERLSTEFVISYNFKRANLGNFTKPLQPDVPQASTPLLVTCCTLFPWDSSGNIIKKSDCNAYYKSGQFDAEVLVQNLFEVLTGHVLFIVCCHGWYYLCNQTYKSLLSYNQISKWNKKIKNENDLIRLTSQFCEQSKSINVAERFPQSILLHHTAFITTLATLGTTWEQCGQAWAQLGDHLQTTS